MLARALSSTSKWSLAGIMTLLFVVPACQYESVLDTLGCEFDTDCPGTNVCLDGYCIEEILPVDPLDRISLTPAATSLVVGETVTFAATLLDADGTALTDRTPTWSSSNTDVATIEDGVVTAMSPGTVLIRASSGRVSASAALSVLAEPDPVDPTDPLFRIIVTPAVASLTVGSTANFSAQLLDEDGAEIAGRQAEWESADGQIATVDGNGQVTAVAPGTTVIRASSGIVSAAAAVTVTSEEIFVADMTVDPTSATILVGDAVQLTGTAFDDGGAILGDRVIAWSTSDASVAIVGSTGLVTGIAAGVATIMASSEGEQAEATIVVEDRGPDSIQLVPQGATLAIDETVEITAIVRDDQGKQLDADVSFNSDDEAIATVDEDGLVTARGTGATMITVTSEGATAEFVVSVVSRSVTSVALSPLSMTLEVGATQALDAVAWAAGAELVGRPVDSWTSDSAGVASVNANGIVTAVAPGIAVMTATIDGIEGRAFVQVIPRTITAVSVSPNSASIREGEALSLSATAFADGDSQTGRIALWSSNDTTVATVDSNGRVYGIGEGTVTITAEVEGETGTSTITVAARAADFVEVTPMAASLEVGDALTLSAVVRAADGRALTAETVTWSTASSVVSVSSAGLVTALAPGVATVTATSDSDGTIAGTATITVNPRSVTSVTVSPTTLTRAEGDAAVQLDIEVRAGGDIVTDRAVVWTSSDASVATVSDVGQVSFVAPGTALITATSEGYSASTAVTVTAMPVTEVVIASLNSELEVGESTTFGATVRNGSDVLTGRVVQWFSSDSAVAVVDGSGTVVARSAGTTTITAVSEGVESNGIAVVVTDPAPEPEPEAATIQLLVTEGNFGGSAAAPLAEPGMAFTVTAIVLDTEGDVMEGHPVTFTADPGTAVSVDPLTGEVVAIEPGTETITATSDLDGDVTGSITLTISFTFDDVAVGGETVCGLSTLGNLYCWGANGSAQYGDGSLTGSNLPRLVAKNTGLTSLVMGSYHGCGLAAGQAYCWGLNDRGQLGDGTTLDSRFPVAAAGTQVFTKLAVGERHSCGLADDGVVYCWGANDFGQLGDDTTTDRHVPTAVEGTRVFTDLGAGQHHSCALRDDLRIYCWGSNSDGQVGRDASGVDAVTSNVRPRTVTGGSGFVAIAIGGHHGCAIEDKASDPETYCWGRNAEGQLGDGSTSSNHEPQALDTSERFASLTAGAAHGCGLTTSGDALCWGLNTEGQLGNGNTTSPQSSPVAVTGGVSFESLSAGGESTCGVATDGRVLCWGRGDEGQLGDDLATSRATPSPILWP